MGRRGEVGMNKPLGFGAVILRNKDLISALSTDSEQRIADSKN